MKCSKHQTHVYNCPDCSDSSDQLWTKKQLLTQWEMLDKVIQRPEWMRGGGK